MHHVIFINQSVCSIQSVCADPRCLVSFNSQSYKSISSDTYKVPQLLPNYYVIYIFTRLSNSNIIIMTSYHWKSCFTASNQIFRYTLDAQPYVVQFSLLWDHSAAAAQVNLLRISAPYLLAVHCRPLALKLLSLVTLD